ncbi:polysaccharide deacetylase [Asticcacaulis sp. AC460]|uniref:polysaccharide deacetylase family protein n=1 Tax=Asticcacaulis sp. AC460 TaxID=1282360 RepID=UPI0003C3C3E3|nr:polysaccharide deacetylase family protein [Asticcacaulis sp. AC460]ESQ92124.1 polysaccharide deacetylase [Asticcacaulis sp. AC460]
MTRFDRRAFLAGLLALGTTPAWAADAAPGLSVTIDDFDLSPDPLMSGEARDQRLREAVERRGVKAAGFVAGRNAVDEVGARVLTAWSDGGHLIGNHTFSHGYYNGSDPQAYWQDIAKAEAVLKPFAGFRKLFRFPFLAEGKTVEGRDALRKLLSDNGYRNGHVTIDTSDWFYSSRLLARLKADPKADLAPYRQAYLDHMWEKATFYDGVAKTIFGRSIDHTLLMHHNVINGLFLGDLLAMFKARGWRLVDAASAFDQPELIRTYDAMPSGQSVVLQAAIAAGHPELARYPGEDSAYEKAKLDALGL